jgi:hypothetical protein
MDIINWLLRGKLPTDSNPVTLSYNDMRFRLQSMIIQMRVRCITEGSDDTMMVNVDELVDICERAQYKFVITGCIVPWHNFRDVPFWALSIDRIFPLKYTKLFPRGAWSKNNVQVMSKCLNTTKGHYSNQEVK